MSEDRPVPESQEEARSDGEPEQEAVPTAEPSRAPAPEPEEIDLAGGRTLSDYLEEEPESSAPSESNLKSVANAVGLVMPPPAGALRMRGGEEAPGSKPERAGSPEPPASTPAPAPRILPPQSTVRPAPIQAGDEGNFGEMLEQTLQAKTFEEGQTVRGTVVAIGPDAAFIDYGGKSEAAIEIAELRDHEGDIEVEVGDVVEALVISTPEGLRLSRKLARGAAAKEQLADAFRAALPVEGRIEKSIKGGYEVRIAGQRAFCPVSQIDIVRGSDPAAYLGQVHTFKIIEYKEGGKNLVVSRRALLEEERRALAEETRKKIVPGAVLPGRVVSVREYGAFVDLGGTQGLLHVSEMGWARVTNAAEVVKPGDEVTVKVLRIDEQKGRISLGLKQLQQDPWEQAAGKYEVGTAYPGRIVRLQDFGAFVQLEPGIEGLAHVSTFPPTGTPDGWKKTVPPGTEATFEVLSVDRARKRIGVAMLVEGHTRAADHEGVRPAPTTPAQARDGRITIAAGARLKGKVERHEKFGVFVYLAPGRTGLMPLSETGEPRGADIRKAFPIGNEIEVVVLETDPGGRRIRLSRRAMLEAEEKDDAREFSQKRQAAEAFGSIGDKLRAALASKKK